jgi:D-glycero-D-manno-heptose 1,7-bisphosphate phosphatase
MNKAVFLDRDGVINRKGKNYYVFDESDFEFNEGLTEALRYFMAKGYLLIVITNQGGIAKGRYTVEQLEKLHERMISDLKKEEVLITDIYYCPHHPDISACLCRKPGTLMFEQAIARYDIDPSSSYMIGDSEIDVQASEKIGVKGILIPTNSNLMELIAGGIINIL